LIYSDFFGQKNRFFRFGRTFWYFEVKNGHFLTEKSTFSTKKSRKIVFFDYRPPEPKFDALSESRG